MIAGIVLGKADLFSMLDGRRFDSCGGKFSGIRGKAVMEIEVFKAVPDSRARAWNKGMTDDIPKDLCNLLICLLEEKKP